MVFRNGDLSEIPGAAELIDSAQAVATDMAHQLRFHRERAVEAEREAAECRLALCTMDEHNGQLVETICGLRAEVARLREAICEYNAASAAFVHDRSEDAYTRKCKAIDALRKIAREGR